MHAKTEGSSTFLGGTAFFDVMIALLVLADTAQLSGPEPGCKSSATFFGSRPASFCSKSGSQRLGAGGGLRGSLGPLAVGTGWKP